MESKHEQRFILVTGANKGIGFEIVKKLVQSSSECRTEILLGCRDLTRGQQALLRLGSSDHVRLLQLDLSSEESIIRAVDEIKTNYGAQLDVVINNAAIGEDEITVQAARTMLSTNYYGLKRLNDYVFPLVREHGRVINVASACGPTLLFEASKDLQEKYSSPTLTVEELDGLVEAFIDSIETNTFETLGYNADSAYLIYSATKAAVIALTKIEARQWSTNGKKLFAFSVCPGFCTTDLNKNAPGGRPAALGANSILHLVQTSINELENGGFYRDGQLLPQIGLIHPVHTEETSSN